MSCKRCARQACSRLDQTTHWWAWLSAIPFKQGHGRDAKSSRGMRRGVQRSGPYDRNKFLQANFRFLVSDAADLRAHQSDADLMLDWGDVLEAGIQP